MKVTETHTDALRELINIGVGRAAGVLNQMVSAHIVLQVPVVRILTVSQLKEEMREFGRRRLAAVKLSFQGNFSGTAELVFPPESASRLVAILTGEELGTPDLDAVRAGTLGEVGNIVLNGVMGSIVNVLSERLEFGLPSYVEDSIDRLVRPDWNNADLTVLLAKARFSVVEREIEGDVIVVFEMGAFDKLLQAIDKMMQQAPAQT